MAFGVASRWRRIGDLRIASELVGFCAVLTMLIWGFASFIGGTPLILISARSNFVSYSVNRPEVSAFSVPSLYLPDAARLCPALVGAEGNWLALLILPPHRAQIDYAWNPGWAMVTVDLEQASGPLMVEQDGRPPCKIDQRSTSFMIRAETLRHMPPLPVVGPGEIGREIASAKAPLSKTAPPTVIDEAGQEETLTRSGTSTFWGGTLRVFGRTGLYGDKGRLYPVPDSEYMIPRGARLTTDGPADAFTGSAVFPEDDRPGFDIEVTANTDSLVLFRPGPESQRETFAIGIVARAFADPSSARLLLALAIFAFIFQLVVGAITLSDLGRRRR